MKFIKNYLEKKEDLKNIQSKCRHEWFKIPVEVSISSYSLFSLLVSDVNKLQLKTEGYICRKCGKDVFVDIR